MKQELLEKAAELWLVTPKDIMGKRRLRLYTRPRFAVSYALRSLGLSYNRISSIMDRECHTCSINACDRTEEWMGTDPVHARKVAELVTYAQQVKEHRP